MPQIILYFRLYNLTDTNFRDFSYYLQLILTKFIKESNSKVLVRL
jgi:hypothetical protein